MPANDPERINAIGMKCPWPALRAARAMRTGESVLVEADDPMAATELAVLAGERGWHFQPVAPNSYVLSSNVDDRSISVPA